MLITPAPSLTVYLENLPRVGILIDKIYREVFENFGILVSSSIPVGSSIAIGHHLVKRGDDISLTSASAGHSAAFIKLT